jgi:hypothetical protein
MACSQNEGTAPAPSFHLLTSDSDDTRSSEMGNFAATAVKEAYQLDFAFLPAKYYRNRQDPFEVRPGMSTQQINRVLQHFPQDPQDQLLIGSLSGRHIKEFLIRRSEELYNVDIETAGLWYDITFLGGVINSSYMTIEGRLPVDDDQMYRVAISDDFFFGSAFPGYKFRNNFNFFFTRERLQASIHEAVKEYLQTESNPFPDWSTPRAQVRNVAKEFLGFQEIPVIQGAGHASPLRGHHVITRGVVTAVGSDNWYPYDLDIYIQAQAPDDSPLTSEGLHISSQFNSVDVQLGQLIEVRGEVMEEMRTNGLGETTLRLTEPPKILQDSVPLPKTVELANIPTDRISTFDGSLMLKGTLNLNDGIDYWESLEGMRVRTKHLVVSGFRGGGEDLLPISDRFYLNLYVYSRDSYSEELLSQRTGLMPDLLNDDFNPELFVITTNHLSKGIAVEKGRDEYYAYNIGDEIAHPDLPEELQSLEGVMTYPKNIFGGGEYALVLPEPQPAMDYRNIKTQGFVELEDRPVTRLHSEVPQEITMATFNLENLAGNRQDRIDKLGEVVATNLRCPDLINLVEIQDNNGFSLRAGTNAEITLKKVMISVQQRCLDGHYDYLNIDPFEQSEGGQPGGNIRISVLYNKDRLGFEPRGTLNPLDGGHTGVLPDGRLSLNPGRVFPLASAFRRSRRSPVMEFFLQADPQKKLYLIGAHLNSKLGDTDFWGNTQPVAQLSDDRRAQMADAINQFACWIESANPTAQIFVMGDFNALLEESSMSVLAGTDRFLENTMEWIPHNQRYTTNHNGNSQPLDYIFVNQTVAAKDCSRAEVVHLNSDFMGRISDHDPVILKTCF